MDITTLLWLITGAALCISELCLPTQFILLLMGLSALVVAAVSSVITTFSLQVIAWLSLSTLGVWLLMKFSKTKKPRFTSLADQTEAETLTEILPGQTGRILYEGNSWRGKLVDQSQSISANQKVFVVRREGNTLIVIPEQFLSD